MQLNLTRKFDPDATPTQIAASWVRVQRRFLLILLGLASWKASSFFYSAPAMREFLEYHRNRPVLHVEANASPVLTNHRINFTVFVSNIGNVPAEVTLNIGRALGRESFDSQTTVATQPAVPITTASTPSAFQVRLGSPLEPGSDLTFELSGAICIPLPEEDANRYKDDYSVWVQTQKGSSRITNFYIKSGPNSGLMRVASARARRLECTACASFRRAFD